MSVPRCPNCDLALQPVTARARSGYLLALDQCSRCGGVWCDRWELFPIDAAEVAHLDPVDQPALWAPVATVKRELKCPRCGTPLQRFHDPLLPEDVHMERCRACEGLWLNRGELRHFKARDRLVRPPPLPDAAIKQLAAGYANGAQWPTVSSLASAGSAAPSEEEDAPEAAARDLMWSAAWLGLRALLRLLLHI